MNIFLRIIENGNAVTGDRFLEFQIFRFLDKLVQVARVDKLEELGKGRTGKALQDAEVQDDVGCWMLDVRCTKDAEVQDAEP